MKKILVFAMILCTLLLALTGCSNNAEPEATEAPAATIGTIMYWEAPP